MVNKFKRDGHIPRKRFGQHFLTDTALLDEMVHLIDPRRDETLVEIGPGLGALTAPLSRHVDTLTVIELDRDLITRLKQWPNLAVIEGDVLKVDFTVLSQRLEQRLRVVGNLPYNISTPILFHLLESVDVIQDQHFMLQKEVVDRIAARPSTKDYGRLSVMLQWRYEVENILDVPPESFDPPPKIDSAVIRMTPHKQFTPLDQKLLSEVVMTAFSQRRKILRHSLGKWLDARQIDHHFDLQRRAEEVPVEEYIQLVAHI